MKYIFGLGLPRTGMNSLGMALHMMGYNGECSCILNDYHNKREKDNSNDTYKYILFNDAFQELDSILHEDKIRDNKYILTIRDQQKWIQSLSHFHHEKVGILKQMSMEEYSSTIKKYFVQHDCLENLLILHIFEEEDEDIWKKLYDFLELDEDEDIVDSEFPNINLNQT